MKLPSARSGLSPKIFLKIFLIIFPKKTCSEKFSYVFSKKPPNFQEIKLSYIFLKIVFLIFRQRYIQNSDIFRTRSIFRTLVYSEPETYSGHCQTSAMACFAKKPYHFATLSYIHGNDAFLINISFVFQEVTFRFPKAQRTNF